MGVLRGFVRQVDDERGDARAPVRLDRGGDPVVGADELRAVDPDPAGVEPQQPSWLPLPASRITAWCCVEVISRWKARRIRASRRSPA